MRDPLTIILSHFVKQDMFSSPPCWEEVVVAIPKGGRQDLYYTDSSDILAIHAKAGGPAEAAIARALAPFLQTVPFCAPAPRLLQYALHPLLLLHILPKQLLLPCFEQGVGHPVVMAVLACAAIAANHPSPEALAVHRGALGYRTHAGHPGMSRDFLLESRDSRLSGTLVGGRGGGEGGKHDPRVHVEDLVGVLLVLVEKLVVVGLVHGIVVLLEECIDILVENGSGHLAPVKLKLVVVGLGHGIVVLLEECIGDIVEVAFVQLGTGK